MNLLNNTPLYVFSYTTTAFTATRIFMAFPRVPSISETFNRLSRRRSHRRRRSRTISIDPTDSGNDGRRLTWLPPAILTFGVASILLASYSCDVKLYPPLGDWDGDYLFAACVMVLATFFVSLLLQDRLIWIPRDEATNVFGWEGQLHEE